ncbi:MAG: hypothetical protein Q8O59_01755 [bacterium]|nr:hypothetical protein [bacterium]
MRSLNAEHLQKIQEGRKNHLARTNGLVCTIDERIQIWADQYQFILKVDGSLEGYYPDIISVLHSLFDSKAKELMIADKRKDLISVRDAIVQAQKWLNEVVSPILEGVEQNQNKITTPQTNKVT